MGIGDAVLGLNRTALVTGGDEMKAVTVLRNARLGWLILGGGSCGCQGRRGYRGRRGRWLVIDGANNTVDLAGCESRARDADVQSLKICKSLTPG